jgi:hypothetical protein
MMAQEFPSLHVEVIDIDRAEAEKPEQVFAVPTFLLASRIISLGNPSLAELRRQIWQV